MDCYKGNARKTELNKAIIAIIAIIFVGCPHDQSLATATKVVAKTSFYKLISFDNPMVTLAGLSRIFAKYLSSEKTLF